MMTGSKTTSSVYGLVRNTNHGISVNVTPCPPTEHTVDAALLRMDYAGHGDSVESRWVSAEIVETPTWWGVDTRRTAEGEMYRGIEAHTIRTRIHRSRLSWIILTDNAYVHDVHDQTVVLMDRDATISVVSGTSTIGAVKDRARIGSMEGSSRVVGITDDATIGFMRNSSVVCAAGGRVQIGRMLHDAAVNTADGKVQIYLMAHRTMIGRAGSDVEVRAMRNASIVGRVVPTVRTSYIASGS